MDSGIWGSNPIGLLLVTDLVHSKHTSPMQIFAGIGSKFAAKLVKTGGNLVPMAAKIWWCAKNWSKQQGICCQFICMSKVCLACCGEVVFAAC